MQLLSPGDGDISGGGVGTDPAIGSLEAKGTHSCTGLINTLGVANSTCRTVISPFATMMFFSVKFQRISTLCMGVDNVVYPNPEGP
jgi:hypothetical protein